MASRRALYALAVNRRKKPPRYQSGEAGPPIPGYGQVQREKIRRANEAYLGTNEGASRPKTQYTPIRSAPYRPRRRRRTTYD